MCSIFVGGLIHAYSMFVLMMDIPEIGLNRCQKLFVTESRNRGSLTLSW